MASHASVSSLSPKEVFPAEAPLYGKLDVKVKQLTTADGLPQNQIFDITATADGMLWLATGMGLVRYDGARFKLYDRGNSGMKADFCTALAVDTKGNVWVGTYSGYSVLTQNGFRHNPPLPGGKSEKKILRMRPSRDGGVWIKTDSSIWRVTDEQRRHVVSLKDGLNETAVLTLREDAEGSLFIRCDRGRVKVDPKRKQKKPEKFQWEGEGVDCPHYVGRGGYARLDKESVDSPRMKRALTLSRVVTKRAEVKRTRWVTSFHKTPNLWLARGQNKNAYSDIADCYLYQYIPGYGWHLLRRFSGIALEGIYQDRQGHIWLGTYANGLYQIIPQPISSITKADGLKRNMVRSVHPATGGGVWAALRGEKLYRVQKGEVNQYGTPYGGKAEDYRVVYQDSAGRVWFGGRTGFDVCRNGTIDRLRYKRLKSLPTEIREGDVITWTLLEDSHHHIWVGTEKGLLRFDGGRLHSLDDHFVIPEGVRYYDENPDLSNVDVRAIHEDAKGRTWVGTAEQGIYRLADDDTFSHYTNTEGLSADHINGFYEDETGMLWISTVTGLVRFHKGHWTTFAEDDGLHDDRVHTVVPDGMGNFWMSSNRGVFRVERSALNAVASGKKKEVESVVYTEIDGMASAEANGDYQHVGCRGEDGFLYFPTTKGVVAFKPKTVTARETAPQVILFSVAVDTETVAQYVGPDFTDTVIEGPFRLGPGRGSKTVSAMRFETGQGEKPSDSKTASGKPDIVIPPGRGDLIHASFTLASPARPREWHFRYRLLGYSSDWVETKLQRQVYYPNLPPGRYRLQVKGRNAHGLWSRNDASFSFVIQPHFYQTAYFYAATGGVGLLLLWGGHRFRLRRRQKWIELENALKLEREKGRIAQDIHDEVGSHVTRLRFASELAKQHTGDSKKLREQLDHISEIAGEVSNSFGEVIWLTNPKHDNLKNLFSYLRRYISEFTEGTALKSELHFPDSVPDRPISPDLRRNLYLTVKECLNNIVKHARAARVTVAAELNEGRLRLRIDDDGRGIAGSSSRHGHGMMNMQMRIQAVGGLFSVDSTPGQGTRIDIDVPLVQHDRNR